MRSTNIQEQRPPGEAKCCCQHRQGLLCRSTLKVSVPCAATLSSGPSHSPNEVLGIISGCKVPVTAVGCRVMAAGCLCSQSKTRQHVWGSWDRESLASVCRTGSWSRLAVQASLQVGKQVSDDPSLCAAGSNSASPACEFWWVRTTASWPGGSARLLWFTVPDVPWGVVRRAAYPCMPGKQGSGFSAW